MAVMARTEDARACLRDSRLPADVFVSKLDKDISGGFAGARSPKVVCYIPTGPPWPSTATPAQRVVEDELALNGAGWDLSALVLACCLPSL